MTDPLPCCGRTTEKVSTICCGRRWFFVHDKWERVLTWSTMNRYRVRK